jgi:DNA-binding response OmpR family regulator
MEVRSRTANAIDVAPHGEDAASGWPAHPNTVTIVLDVMLPGQDGFEVCPGLRAAGSGRTC